jgi:flagellar biosynthesis chaperone FliJ
VTGERSPKYPLEPLRLREGWRLELLQTALAAASRRLAETNNKHVRLCRERRMICEDSAMVASAVIDPCLARNRLRYLDDLSARIASTVGSIRELESDRERIRQQASEQRDKLESLERHRRRHAHELASAASREEANEADREWLGRSQWRTLVTASATGD